MRAPLTKLARPSGALAMVAVDQREALRGMFAAHQSTPVPDSQLTQFKVDVAPPPTKNGHAPPPIESRKSYQSVNPYYVWTW